MHSFPSDNFVPFPMMDLISIDERGAKYTETNPYAETSNAMAASAAQPCDPVPSQYEMAVPNIPGQFLPVTATIPTAQEHSLSSYTAGEFPVQPDVTFRQPNMNRQPQTVSPKGQVQQSVDMHSSISHGFKCKWEGCRHSGCFSREGDLIRHIKKLHISPGAHLCPMQQCGAIFNPNDNLNDHLKRRHGGVKKAQGVRSLW